MNLTAKQKYELKKLLKELSTYKGRHTELVTVYVPSGYEMTKIINHLSQEQGTATNIKSTSTRKNVIDALERMIQHLRLFKQTPENGLACFSGNVAEREGQSDVKVWSIEPPNPLKIRIYRCDKTFVLEPLYEMMEIKDVYGLVVMDRRDADIALLKGKTIIPIKKTHSEVPGKMRAGGQSAPRFARLREGATKDHYKKIAEYMKEEFLQLEGLKGIIIGGPGTTINDFMNKDYLTGDLKKKIIGTKDLSYTGLFGLHELLDKSTDILAAEEVAEEKEIMQKFFNLLATKTNMVAYGEEDVLNKIQMGAAETVLLSEALDDSVIEKFEKESEKMNSTVKIISLETREGAQLKDMGKVAAILRYEVA
ncbi:peptide chain release factor aRF-1 [Candidatus Woesearchaeota archaeon]|nr:peptide chain release factor aRF-1 [Candidatus Woesearchaeota archaeon]MBW3021441.1 peptide chain release factor aRF-1 [Candidatus Woesearchaeota archaeon]